VSWDVEGPAIGSRRGLRAACRENEKGSEPPTGWKKNLECQRLQTDLNIDELICKEHATGFFCCP
jgi:hypothetical protein